MKNVFINIEEGMKTEVITKNNGLFAVVTTDLDADMIVPLGVAYPNIEDAIKNAKLIANVA